MKILKDDKGFFLLEALLLCLVLMALSGVFSAYRLSEQMHADIKAHIAAIFLAQEQMAYVAEKGSEGKLSTGRLSWLGSEEALSLNRKNYEVYADVAALDAGTGICRVQVTAAWEQSGKARRVSFERMVRNVATVP